MKFVCDRCHTKYSIADEKVRGKILKVRCKSCSNVITVREAPAAAPAQPEPVEFEESANTVIVPSVPDHIAAANRAAAAARRPSGAMRAVGTAPPAAPPPAPADDVQWFLALEGVQKGPFSRKILIDKLVALPRDADVHVWNEKLDGWKPPKDVAVVERDLQARRRQTVAPPPPPGMRPRVPTGPQPLAAAGAATPRRTGSHALPGPQGSATASAASGHAPGIGTAEHPQRARRPTNGVAANGAAPGVPVAPLTGESDALNALNLKHAGAAASHAGHEPGAAHAPVPALDVGSGADVAGAAAPWQAPAVPTISTSPSTSMVVVPRQRSTKLIIGFLGIVGVIVVVVTFSLFKKPAAPVVAEKPSVTSPEQGFAAMADKVQQEQKQPAVEPPTTTADPFAAAAAAAAAKEAAAKAPTIATVKPTKQNKRAAAAAAARARAAGRGGRPAAVAGAAPGETVADPTASRFADSSGRSINVQGGGGGGARSTPSQSDISRVISNNKAGIKICYQRALLRDSSLTHGKIAVRVSIGLSGRAKSVHVDGPAPFRALEPCIREVLSRWAFPASSEEYGTEFSYIFQGNE